ncbi:MAG: hypothetical protein AB1664_16445 [Thermodesulfobacteriota bacterium]
MIILPPVQLDDPVTWALMAAIFGVTTIIEFLVIYWMLDRPRSARITLFFVAFLLNMVTNLPAQIGVWFVGDWFAIEVVVIAIEFGVMMLIFSQMYHSGKLDHRVTVPRTALIVLVANLTSFALGVVGFLFLHIMWPRVISVLWA